jgi:hypothetical protein
MYVVPMNATTKPICRKMGVWPLKLSGNQDTEILNALDAEEETHYFACFSQMRHTFPQ